MHESTQEALVDELQHEPGDALRSVGRYDDDVDLLSFETTLRPSARRGSTTSSTPECSKTITTGRNWFQANILAFEDLLGADLLGTDEDGHVTTIGRGADFDLQRFLRGSDIVTAMVRQFKPIQFEHDQGGLYCPLCRSDRTIFEPRSRAEYPYHCLACDSSFS